MYVNAINKGTENTEEYEQIYILNVCKTSSKLPMIPGLSSLSDLRAQMPLIFNH